MVLAPGPADARAGGLSFEELEHELRTPLASIRSLSEILRDHPDLDEAQRRSFLAGVVAESERLARTVERLLGSMARRGGAR